MVAYFNFAFSFGNLVSRDFSLAWGRGAQPQSQGKDPGNEVVHLELNVCITYLG